MGSPNNDVRDSITRKTQERGHPFKSCAEGQVKTPTLREAARVGHPEYRYCCGFSLSSAFWSILLLEVALTSDFLPVVALAFIAAAGFVVKKSASTAAISSADLLASARNRLILSSESQAVSALVSK